MINIDKSSTEKYYVLSKDNADIYHYGKLSVGQTLISGLDTIEQFENEDEFLLRLDQINSNFKNEYLENLNEQI